MLLLAHLPRFPPDGTAKPTFKSMEEYPDVNAAHASIHGCPIRNFRLLNDSVDLPMLRLRAAFARWTPALRDLMNKYRSHKHIHG